MQIDVATSRAGEVESQDNGEALDPDVTASHANHQAPATGPEAKDVHYTQEAHHTHCHHQWTKRPSRLSLLLPGGPGWVRRSLCGLVRAASMRMTKASARAEAQAEY